MKYLSILLGLLLIGWSCKSKKTPNTSNTKTETIQHSKLFTYTDATYQHWYGGREGVKGITIEIKGIKPIEGVTFNSVYFNNKKGKIFTTTKETTTLKGSIDTSDPRPQRAHVEPIEEYGNVAPVKPKYPSALKNEAIIEYTFNGTEKIWRLKLRKIEPLFYP